MPDGHIYGLPGISEMGYIDDDGTYIGIGAIPQFTSINKDWLEAVGMEMRQHSMNSMMYLLHLRKMTAMEMVMQLMKFRCPLWQTTGVLE